MEVKDVEIVGNFDFEYNKKLWIESGADLLFHYYFIFINSSPAVGGNAVL